ncbi:hypothetical protein GCM10010104_36660 [Streptomyces indiaensis]|uniref:Uncharacterized protein n=1 Tax=Streptomyces indiaensis TaxID=284033 RepID=A0ABP5QNJ4_9ACTN
MPLVFVHGVANRISERYNESLSLRDSYFRQYVISTLCRDPESVPIFNPPWGQYGAVLHWSGASLTVGENEDFGPTDELDLLTSAILPIAESEDSPLLNLARESLIEAVDLLGQPQASLSQLRTWLRNWPTSQP